MEPESVKISDPLRLAGLRCVNGLGAGHSMDIFRGLEVSSVEFINCKVPKCSGVCLELLFAISIRYCC